MARVINVTLITALAFITLYPFWYVLCVAFSDYHQVIKLNFVWLPVGFTLDNLNYVITTPDFLNIYANTAFTVIVGTLCSMTCTVFFSYGLARKVPGHKWMSYGVFFMLLFNGGMIPTFLVVRSVGLLDSLWALILPRLVDPFYVFLMRNFFAAIPESLDESASLEGAGPLTILVRVVIPVSLPGIATVALFYGVFYWNQFFDALLYIGSRSHWTLQVLLRELLIALQPDILGSAGTSAGNTGVAQTLSYSVKMATVVTAVVPVMCIYPFLQRYFVQGVIVGAVKG